MRRANSGRRTWQPPLTAYAVSNPGIVDAILRRKSVPRGGENNNADLSSGRESIPLPCRDRNILGALPARGRDTRSAGDADALGATPPSEGSIPSCPARGRFPAANPEQLAE